MFSITYHGDSDATIITDLGSWDTRIESGLTQLALEPRDLWRALRREYSAAELATAAHRLSIHPPNLNQHQANAIRDSMTWTI